MSSTAPTASETTAPAVASPMKVRKRNGSFEPVDVNKIVRAVGRCCVGPRRTSTRCASPRKTISGLYDGATTRELDQLSIQTAAALIAEEPRVLAAGRAPARDLHRQGSAQPGDPRRSRSRSRPGHALRPHQRPAARASSPSNARKLNDAIDAERDRPRSSTSACARCTTATCCSHPQTRAGDRDAAALLPARRLRALGETSPEALELYRLFSLARVPAELADAVQLRHAPRAALALLPARLARRTTCEAIYDKYTDVALLSKFSGGIGLAYHRVRSRGSLIRGTNGHSNGIVPWLKTLDASVAAVNQGGKRKGACCVYLETWHADIEEFLELRDNTGDEARRTHNLNLAQLGARPLHAARRGRRRRGRCSTPRRCPQLPDLYGATFEAAYDAGRGGRARRAKQLKARDLYARMMRTLAQTGNGWMTFKDTCNRAVQPDRRSRRTSCTSRTSAPRSSR